MKRDIMRDLVIGKMSEQKNSEEIFEEAGSSVLKNKKMPMSQNFKNDIFAALENNGYSLKNGSVQAAVSMFFTNLDNL